MRGLQTRDLTPVLDRLATARSPEAYRDAEGELFALEVEIRRHPERLVADPVSRVSATAKHALSDLDD